LKRKAGNSLSGKKKNLKSKRILNENFLRTKLGNKRKFMEKIPLMNFSNKKI